MVQANSSFEHLAAEQRTHSGCRTENTVESCQNLRHCTYDYTYNDGNVWFHLCLKYAYMLAGQ